jgi:hypothetical protein
MPMFDPQDEKETYTIHRTPSDEWATSSAPHTIHMTPSDEWATTKGLSEKVNTIGKFLKSFLELVEDEKELHRLCSMIDHYA